MWWESRWIWGPRASISLTLGLTGLMWACHPWHCIPSLRTTQSGTHDPHPPVLSAAPVATPPLTTQKIFNFPGVTRREPRFLLHTTMRSCWWLRWWCGNGPGHRFTMDNAVWIAWRMCPREWRGSKRTLPVLLLLLLFHGEVFRLQTARCSDHPFPCL